MSTNHDRSVLLEYCKANARRMLKNPKSVFQHPFIDPGAGYEDNLWDWDSYYSAKALMDLCEYCKEDLGSDYESMKKDVCSHAKGNILNFLAFQHEDGFIPMSVAATGIFRSYLSDAKLRGELVNQHKPFLCQGIVNVSEYCHDYQWIANDKKKVEKYLQLYQEDQFDAKSGLFFWHNDVMIGIDNNPSVFGRNDNSAADIYLNTMLYLEFISMKKIMEAIGEKDKVVYYEDKAKDLSNAINSLLWDPRDAFYYTGDLQVRTHKTEIFHHGIGAFWQATPIKIRVWSGFLPLLCGIADKEKADAIVQRHYHDEDFRCDYGIRTLSRDEKMYNTENSSNPSNWLGAVWIVANYGVFKGLLNHGFIEEADEMASNTVSLLVKDISEHGCMSESYVPETGDPMMHGGFLNWNLLSVSMLKELEDWRKANK